MLFLQLVLLLLLLVVLQAILQVSNLQHHLHSKVFFFCCCCCCCCCSPCTAGHPWDEPNPVNRTSKKTCFVLPLMLLLLQAILEIIFKTMNRKSASEA
jgi:hypothetical protein